MLLICLSLNSSLALALNIWDCPSISAINKKYYKYCWQQNVSRSKRRDIERYAKICLDYFKKDCTDRKYIDLFKEQTKKMVHRGWKSEVAKLNKELVRVGRYQVPSKLFKKLNIMLSKLKVDKVSILSNNIKYSQIIKSNKKNRARIKASCTNKDNRRSPPILQKTRNQGKTGWCYAYTTADILSHRLGSLVSAADIANTYNNYEESWDSKRRNLKESEQRAGSLATALIIASRKGLCLEKDVRSSYFSSQPESEMHKAMQELEDLKQDLDLERLSSPVYSSQTTNNITAMTNVNPLLRCRILQGQWRGIFPNLMDDQVFEILKKSKKLDIFNQMIQASCKNKRKRIKEIRESDAIYLSLRQVGSSDGLISKIDDVLNNGEIVGINYHNSILRDPTDTVYGKHVSSVIARKFDSKTKSCLYLLRNSWGNNCEIYPKEYYTCRNGQIWVPQNLLARMVYGVTYIK